MPADYEPLLHVVLHQPEIPYNTGSVGRTCVAVGAKLWLVRPLGFRVDDYYLRRAGLDYWEHLVWQVVDNWDELQAAAARPADDGCSPRRPSGRTSTSRIERGDVLVFGSESAGLPDSLLGRPRRRAAPHPHALRRPQPQPVERRRRRRLRSAAAMAGRSDGSTLRQRFRQISARAGLHSPIGRAGSSRLTLRQLPVNIGAASMRFQR